MANVRIGAMTGKYNVLGRKNGVVLYQRNRHVYGCAETASSRLAHRVRRRSWRVPASAVMFEYWRSWYGGSRVRGNWRHRACIKSDGKHIARIIERCNGGGGKSKRKRK